MEGGNVIQDLAIVLVCAGVVTVMFRLLKLPLLLGYLLSGLLVGPNFFKASPIKDLATINELSELGVAFLMFYIGLEFDLKKLKKVLGSAVIAVGLQTVVMIFLGILSAPLMGWSSVNGLFLGCLLAISSTMITVPILREQGAMKSNFARLAIGSLILEDIIAILILVILSGVAVTGRFEWGRAWQVIFFVGVFVVMVYFVGKLLAPHCLRLLKRFGSQEMITVISVALLLGIGELADYFNFSIALGAFLAGSILSQNELAKEIEEAIEPLRNLFTAVFFVTVGMKIEPVLLKEYWVSIILLTLLVVVGKSFTVWLGLFLTGEKSRSSFRAAVCKAQIGEFSFVIAALLTDPGIMAIALGVSLGTILVIPPLSTRSSRIFDYLARKSPQAFKEFGVFYDSFLMAVREQIGKIAFAKLVKRPILQIIMHFLLFNGVLIGAYLGVNYAEGMPELERYRGVVRYGVWVSAALLCLPFLIAIIRNLEVILLLITEMAFTSKTKRVFKRGRMRNLLNTGLLSFVVLIFGGVYLSVAAPYLPGGLGLFVFVGLIVALSFLFWRHIVRVNSRLEHLFIESFSSEVKSGQESRREVIFNEILKMYPWPIRLHDVVIEKGWGACGKRIEELKLREKTGVSVIGLSRDNFTIYDPAPSIPLFPGDRLVIIGKEDESDKAKQLLAEKGEESELVSTGERFKIEKVYLPAGCPLVGSTLAEANIRRMYRVNVVGIQRGEKQITAPRADEVLKADDVLVVVGSTRVVNKFRDAMEA